MRKIVAVMSVALIIAGTFLLVNPFFTPSISEAEPSVALLQDGTAYFIQNTRDSSYIYGVNQENAVTSVARLAHADDSLSRITMLTVCRGEIYALRETFRAQTGRASRWTLFRLDPDGKSLFTVREGTYDRLSRFTSLGSSDGIIYIAGITNDKSAAGYIAISPVENTMAESDLSYAPKGETFTEAVFTGKELFCTLQNGNSVTYKGAKITTNGALSSHALSLSDGRLFSVDLPSGSVFSGLILATSKTAELKDGLFVKAGTAGSADSSVMLATSSGEALILRATNGEITGFGSPDVSLMMNLSFLSNVFTHLNIIILITSVLLLILALMAVLSKKLAFRVASAYSLFAVLILTVIAGFNYQSVKETLVNGRLMETETVASMHRSALENANSGGIYDVSVLDSLSKRNVTRGGSNISISGMLLSVSGKQLTSGMTPDYPAGIPAASILPANLAFAAENCLATGLPESTITTFGGNEYTAYFTPVIRAGKTADVLVTFVGLEDSKNVLDITLDRLVRTGGSLTAVSVILLWIIVFRYMKPMRSVIKHMDKISDGRFDERPAVTAPGEAGELQRAMQEMIVSLGIKNYETKSMISSYYRFVPPNIERLLERASVMEMDCGDSVLIRGNIGVVSVKNYDDAHKELDDTAFMRYINKCFDCIYTAANDCDGLLLSGNLDPGGVRVLFPNSISDGIRFGCDLTESIDFSQEDRVSPEFLVLLHSAEVLYGIAGNENQAFSFLSSSELTTLNSHAARFAEMGVKAAMTGQFRDNLSDDTPHRYIGFISSPKEGHAYKIYELFHQSRGTETDPRLAYDARFQKALQLFYKNDFYLARNIFSSLLKICPDDGVARWYLFACEHFFNSGEDSPEVSHGLFAAE